ncbi:MAG TPA: hypothetical protein VHY20_07355 [Pirellulales bacterium]|jgi:hypothetical protein|nr:hypothetical protein [Pirellulales bacterium]
MKTVKIEVVFNKPRAIEFCESLKAGRPIGKVDADDLLTLAGACLCRHYESDRAEELDELEAERLVKNLMNAVEHCAQWTLRACHGTYDQEYKPQLHATIDNGITTYPGVRGSDRLG